METVLQCLLSWDLLGGNVFRSTRPVSNPIRVLHQDVHVSFLVQDVLFRLKTQTHKVQPSVFMFTMTVLSCQKLNVLYIYACVCDEHKDSFSNLFLTTEKYTKVLFAECSDRSTEKKTESDGDKALCKRNRAPHWVWPPSPWKLKVGSSCRHMTHTLLYTHHFRASGWGCLGNRLMENLRGTWALTWLSLLPVTSTSKMICPSSWGLWGRGGLQAEGKKQPTRQRPHY